MKRITINLLLSLSLVSPVALADKDYVKAFCKERQILADYREEYDYDGGDCDIEEADAKYFTWSLNTLNWGIGIRLSYADRHGIYYDSDTITQHVQDNFRVGQENEWVIDTLDNYKSK